MDEFAFVYERIEATTWAYMSSLLMLALFFKFNRFWSFRNFDLLLIILLAPGLLLVDAGGRISFDSQSNSTEIVDATTEQSQLHDALPAVVVPDRNRSEQTAIPDEVPVVQQIGLPGANLQRWGYSWLFVVGGLLLIRVLLDPSLVRKPLLDPNLSTGGLVFLGISLMIFLFANIITAEPNPDDLRGARDAVTLLQRQAAGESDEHQLQRRGPGYRLFNLIPIIPSFNNGGEILEADANEIEQLSRYVAAAKSLAIASQILIVIPLVWFCHAYYGNFKVGIGIATIYLMLPYTAIFTGHVLHALPAALVLWALLFFRRPWVTGVLVGLAVGVSYYPIFLLPLWASFYWKKGVKRFVSGVLISLGVCILGLVFTSINFTDFVDQLQTMFGFWRPMMDGLEGVWALGWDQRYRLPILVAFVTLCVSFASWPAEKDLGTLVSYSAAVMIAVQFWHGFGGGLYMAWYLPMVLLVFFRPNLTGRVATTEVA